MKHFALPLALLALCQAASAQQPPTGGGLLPAPAAPTLPRAAGDIRLQPLAAPPSQAAPQERVVVQTLRIAGAQRFAEADLLALTGFVPGSALSLPDLQGLADRITSHYHRSGLFAARAFLPAQDIIAGTVTIAVSEGRLGQVTLRNRSAVADRVALDLLAGLEPGDTIEAPPIESRLLQLSDLPGVDVRATMVPGAAPGSSDLLVDLTPGQGVTGSVDADNGGNRYTGAWRVGATVNVNEPLGLGDVASLRVMTSGSGLKYARLSYQLQAGRGQLGMAISRLDYALGREFAPLGAHGSADIASVFGHYPVLRSRSDNVYLQLALDAKRFEDHVDAIPAVTDRQSRVLMASVHGDHRDNAGGGGLTSYVLTWSAGDLDIRTPAARQLDAATAQTQGHFQKLNLSAMRVQRLGQGPFSLYAGVQGQWASKNLDVSEKMELGGMNAVRAYPEGEAYADQGYLVTLEARLDLPAAAATLPGQVQLIAFVDAGGVTLNRVPWTAGDNHRRLSGAGIGVNWADPGNFLVRVAYARRLGGEPATSAPDRSGRFWIQLVKYF